MKNKTQLLKYLKYCIGAFCVFLLIYFIADPDLSTKAVQSLTYKNPFAAASIFLLLYALKSATVFFPLIVLEAAVGHLFPSWVALGINFLGMLIILTVPYWIGRTVGMAAIEKLVQKYPRFEKIIIHQQGVSLFLCFFLRILSCFPGDVVTMYLGATKVPYWKNLLFGILGVFPMMILTTLMGNSIQNPRSPSFWISVVLIVVLSLLSILLYYLYRYRLQKRDDRKIEGRIEYE